MGNKEIYSDKSAILKNFILLTTQKEVLINKVVEKIKKEYKTKNLKFLDIGCADGSVTVQIIDNLSKLYNIEATGIEYSSNLIDNFKKTEHKINLINKDVELLNKLPSSNFILLSHVLSYINNLEDFINKFYKLQFLK